jgi:hypothetical protein
MQGEASMDLQHQFESAHKEHQEILEFLDAWEGVFQLLESADSEERLRGLRQLQGMEPKIAEICEHCRREEEDPESPLFLFAESADRGRMKDEHFRLFRANYDFRTEMQFATVSSTAELAQQGQRLLAALRGHIVYEEGLLKRFESMQLHMAEAVAE